LLEGHLARAKVSRQARGAERQEGVIPMKSSRYPQGVGALVGLLLAACAASETQSSTASQALAEGLACGELERGGAVRPFSDNALGVGMVELRAEDLPTYRGREDDLDPNARVGVRYSVAAVPGSSAAWFERQVHCYRAAHSEARIRDPLLVEEARVSVSTASGRYLVDVTSRDPDTAREVLAAVSR
jgi:hypothetical protein